MTLDLIIKAGSVVTAIGVVGAGWAYLDTFAKKETVAAVEKRLEQKIVNDARRDLQGELWRLQDRYGQKCERGEQAIRERCRNIIEELKELEKK